MLLARRGSWRFAGLALLVALWPGLAAAQAQVEAVPEPPPPFDMWNLEGIDNPALELPGEPELPAPPPGSITAAPPAGPAAPDAPGVSDPCRHFTEEERRLLPGLCGAAD